MQGKVVRPKGKHNADYGIRDIYKSYVEYQEKKGKQILRYSIYRDVIKTVNKEIRKALIDGEMVKLPFLGILGIIKQDSIYSEKNKRKWPVDWVKSKELGFKVYIEQSNYYRLFWHKSNKHQTNKKHYKFVTNRILKRMIPEAIRNGKDYYTYIEKQ
jgi:hypothetical protein